MIPTLTSAPLGALPGLPGGLTLAVPAGPQTTDFTVFLAAELTLASPAMLATAPVAPVALADPAADLAAAPAASGGNILPVPGQSFAAIGLPAAVPITPTPVVATPPPTASKQVVTAPAAPLAQTKSQNEHSAMPAIAAEPATGSDAEIEPKPEFEPEFLVAAPAELDLPPRSHGLAAVPATPAHPGTAPAHTAFAHTEPAHLAPMHTAQTRDQRHSNAPAPTLAPAAMPAPVLPQALALPTAPAPSDSLARRAAAIDPAALAPAPPAPAPIAKAAVAVLEAAATMPAAPERGVPLQPAPHIRIELGAAAPAPAPIPKSSRAGHSAAPTLLESASQLIAAPLAPGSTAAALATPMPIAGPAAADRPLDFTAVLDRLVAAREAVQPQPAALTVAHSEFGPVRLHFAQDERGLAVTLASADPDFARAVAAAPPPVLPANPAQSAGTNTAPGQRGEPSSTGQGAAGNQPRGPHAERRDEPPARAGQTFEHSARSVGQPARHRGIFA